ncbi:MAG: hypothetical protein M3388_16065 [Acidobacteriota bacterium]|nr:hypothetical protein [Acidobacteriota bacterium]
MQDNLAQTAQRYNQYVVFNDLREYCDAICCLGDSRKIMNRIAKCC